EVVVACDEGVVKDKTFHFRRLVDLALALTSQRQGKQALTIYERAIELSESFGDRNLIAILYAGSAKAYQNEGDLEGAIQYNLKRLQPYEELGRGDALLPGSEPARGGARAAYAPRHLRSLVARRRGSRRQPRGAAPRATSSGNSSLLVNRSLSLARWTRSSRVNRSSLVFTSGLHLDTRRQ